MFWALVGDRHTSTVDMAVGRQAAYRLVKESETFFFSSLPIYQYIDQLMLSSCMLCILTL
jgi:hypothetical protein